MENQGNRSLTSSDLCFTKSFQVYTDINEQFSSSTSLSKQRGNLVTMSATLSGTVAHTCGNPYSTPLCRSRNVRSVICTRCSHYESAPSARSRQHAPQTMHRHPLYSIRLRQGRRPSKAVESEVSEGKRAYVGGAWLRKCKVC